MSPDAPGFWLMPSRGRVATNLPRFFRAAAQTGMTTAGYVVIEPDEYAANHDAYDALPLPKNWKVYVVQAASSGEAFEQAKAELFTDEQWLGFLSDDLIPETPLWDIRVLDRLMGCNVVSTNDGAHAPKRMNGAQAWSGDLVRAIGYIYPLGLKHMFVDDVHEQLGRAAGNWLCDMDIMVRHAHASWSQQPDDTMRHANRFYEADNRVYLEWRRAEFSLAMDRIHELFRAYGGNVVTPDFRGVRVMLATASGDGTYESVFMRSYVETRDAVRNFGGELNLAEANYISDPGLMRSRLFGYFLRSNYTHCVWIDADQGWQTKDFIRLLLAGKEFTAAAGVRKVDPPSFACKNVDDNGRPHRIFDASPDGLMKITHVGFAFVCVTKHWAIRMAQHYADLAYDQDGIEEYAIFNPMVLKRRYLGEDYACCQRWRDMGGEIFVAPEVDLEHVGKRVWSGAWLDELNRAAEREQAQRAA